MIFLLIKSINILRDIYLYDLEVELSNGYLKPYIQWKKLFK